MRSVRQTITVAGVIAAVVALPTTARAQFTGNAPATTAVSSASIDAPSSVTLTKKCPRSGNGDSITLTWTASTSAAVTGYLVYFAASGSGVDISKTVSGRTTTSATVNVQLGTTYSITVSSVVQNWTASSTALSAGC